MSDSDDTDLLLLIPPDFFLVRTPDLEDFDSDDDIFSHERVKDAVVSDLITQVNDLESRICHIESLERTSTRCSTCNDDSFVNHSINSLTESDIVRTQIKEKRELGLPSKELADFSHMVKVLKDDPESVADLSQRKLNFITLETDVSSTCETINCNIGNVGLVEDSQNQNNISQKNSLPLSVQLSKDKQKQLLSEVDSFLQSRNVSTVSTLVQKEFSEDDQEIKINNNHLIQSDLPINAVFSEINDHNYSESLALVDVYKLIADMEESQNEMQRKLYDSQQHVQSQDKSGNITGTNRHTSIGKMYGSKVLELEDLYIRSPKSLLGKQTKDFLEKETNNIIYNLESSDAYRQGNTSQTNDLLTHYSSTLEDKSLKRPSRQIPLSPNRIAAGGGYNSIDVVKVNTPKKGERSIQFGESGEGSPDKSVLRRHLVFDKSHSPLRTSKTKPSMVTEQKTNSQNESDKISSALPHRTASRSNLEEKFNSLTLQRSIGVNREDHNTQSCLVNKPSTEVLQQKISSNNLLSLSELWNKEPTFYSDDPNKLRQKLEEERYRRQHCEQQIQTLQLRVLEEQEKLAVAIKVDQEKDRAILQITESWKKLNDHWGELEEQRHSLAQQLHAEKESSKLKSEELTKKVERWEKEVSQALDLAAGYKEKSEAVQKQIESLEKETEERLLQADSQLQNLIEENKKLSEENGSVLEELKVIQERLREEEDLLSKLKSEVEKSRKRILELEAENNVLKEQKSSLTIGIKEERNRITILEQKLNSLQQALNEARKNEKTAQEEARLSSERIEVARTELRALYQGQLESVVKEKLQEFQAQLETAEAALKQELYSKEKQWAEKANEQCRQLHDKYKRDLLRVEEIHKREINSWKEKLKDYERLRVALEKKLQEEADARADLAQRLHGVLETQWREALNIISNPMQQGVYEVAKEETPSRWPSNQQTQSPERLQGKGDVKVSRSDSATSLVQGEDVPFFRDGVVTYRTSQPAQDQQLKKYIQMLLERGPGSLPPNMPTQDSGLQGDPEQEESPGSNSLFDKWLMENEKKNTAQGERSNYTGKPPWR